MAIEALSQQLEIQQEFFEKKYQEFLDTGQHDLENNLNYLALLRQYRDPIDETKKQLQGQRDAMIRMTEEGTWIQVEINRVNYSK